MSKRGGTVAALLAGLMIFGAADAMAGKGCALCEYVEGEVEGTGIIPDPTRQLWDYATWYVQDAGDTVCNTASDEWDDAVPFATAVALSRVPNAYVVPSAGHSTGERRGTRDAAAGVARTVQAPNPADTACGIHPSTNIDERIVHVNTDELPSDSDHGTAVKWAAKR